MLGVFRLVFWGAIGFLFCCNGWSQLPKPLTGSKSLTKAYSRFVFAPGPTACSSELLLSLPTASDPSYWDLVTGLIFERAAEWDAEAHSPESVEHSLELLVSAIKRWNSPLSGEQARREAFAAIHVLAVDLMAQFYVQQSSPPAGTVVALRAHEWRFLELCLELDELLAQAADGFISPLLLRLIDELSLKYFLLNKHLFDLDLRQAEQREGGVAGFFYSHFQKMAVALGERLQKPGSDLGELLRSTLDTSTFIALMGAVVSVETVEGPLLARTWVERFVSAAAWTQSFFLVGYFRQCYYQVEDDLGMRFPESEEAKKTLAELNRVFRPLFKPVSPEQWDRFLATPRLETAVASEASKGFFRVVLPTLEEGRFNEESLLIMKQALLRSIGGAGDGLETP